MRKYIVNYLILKWEILIIQNNKNVRLSNKKVHEKMGSNSGASILTDQGNGPNRLRL